MAAKRRIDVLDGFRGVSIISVLLFHDLARWAPPFWQTNLYGYSRRYSPHLVVGALGVEVFFVISGLVIAMTLAECRNVLEFAVKRFARLYPAYIVAATVTFLLMAAVGPPPFKTALSDYLAGFTMVAADLHHRYVDGAYWSLAVEIKFYALAGIGFAAFRQDFAKFLVGVAVLGTLLAPYHPYFASTFLIAQYMPFFLAGMASWLGILAHRRRLAVGTMAVAISLYAINVHTLNMPIDLGHWAEHAFIFGTCGLMILLLWLAPGAKLGPLSFVGRMSYSLYLLHQFIGAAIIRALKARGATDIAAFCSAVAVSLLLGWISYVLVEGPGRRAVMSIYGRWLVGPTGGAGVSHS